MDPYNIDILCGYNYPEKLLDRIQETLNAKGIKYGEYNICADADVPKVLHSQNIAGGPKKNYTSADGNWG